MLRKHKLQWTEGKFSTWYANSTLPGLSLAVTYSSDTNNYRARVNNNALKLPNKPPTQFATPDDAAVALEAWLLRKVTELMATLVSKEEVPAT